MPIILVVDDSTTDRLLVGELLRKADMDWLVSFAAHGVEALDLVPDLCPDVVITDMIMPEMDGLHFLQSMKKEHPEIPVVMMSGQGTEQLAMEALEKGATSYVPKDELSERLVETIQQILTASKPDSNYTRLIETMEENRYRFSLDNDPAIIPSLIDLIQNMMVGMGICDEASARRVEVAVDEALINAIYHGNLELPKDKLQETRDLLHRGKPVAIIESRRAEEVFRDRRVVVDVTMTREEARITIRDDGVGFQIGEIPKAGDPESLERGGSRGLILMANFADDLRFNEKGNEVTLVVKK